MSQNIKKHLTNKERLETYYPKKSKLMMKILSIISHKTDEIEESEIISKIENSDKDATEILYALVEDHYLLRKTKDGKRIYSFKYQILKNGGK